MIKNLIVVLLVVVFCACDASKNSVPEKELSFEKVEQIAFDSALFENMIEPNTRVVFNQSVELRYAWLGNDAQQVDFETQILKLIAAATNRIDVATQTFTNPAIAKALADKANAGVQVRIITDRKQRPGHGLWKAQTGNLSIVDNNLPALVCRINFQQDEGEAPAGWVVDRGDVYSNHGRMNHDPMNYGWSVSQKAYITSSNLFENPLLDDGFSRPNADGPQTWEMEVPPGYYYVYAMVGHPKRSIHPKNHLLAEGQSIFKTDAGYTRSLETNSKKNHSDLFNGSSIYGGYDSDRRMYNAKRILVTDGRLTITVGNGNDSSLSSLCYLEIYKGDGDADGDDRYEDGEDSTVQDRQAHHTNYIIIDGAMPGTTLWASSANLIDAMDEMSEDAIISTDPDLCNVFLNQFNQKWGSRNGPPDSNNSNFGTYKSATPGLDMTIDGFDWAVRFSPSINKTCDMGAVVNDMVGGAQKDLILMMGQFDDRDAGRGVVSSRSILKTTIPGLLSQPDFDLFAVVGSENFIKNPYRSHKNARVAYSGPGKPATIHNKYALSDVLNDSGRRRSGKVLCGSMNWSQGDLHYNDEHTFIIENPYIANQYLQHAMGRLGDNGIELGTAADIVLIMDQSDSMEGRCLDGSTSKMDAAKSAAGLFVDILEDDGKNKVSSIGFGRKIELMDPPIALEPLTFKRRRTLKKQIGKMVVNPSDESGSSYGLALTEANAQLTGGNSANERQVVHFLTGGRQTVKPDAAAVYPDLSDRGVTIHATAFGIDGRTDILNRMADESGGTYAQVELNALSLKKRFVRVAADAMQLDTLMDEELDVFSGQIVDKVLSVDASAKNLKFIFAWPSKNADALLPVLTTPDGVMIAKKMPGVRIKKSPGHIVICVSPTQKTKFKTAGLWTIKMQANPELAKSSQIVSAIVLADTQMDFKAQVIAGKNPKTALVLARLLSNGKPVTNSHPASLDLKTIVGKPLLNDTAPRDTTLVLMYDDGRHGDGKANDGLYGATLGLPEKGNYTFRIVSYFSRQPVPDREKSMMRQSMAYYSWGLENQVLKN